MVVARAVEIVVADAVWLLGFILHGRSTRLGLLDRFLLLLLGEHELNVLERVFRHFFLFLACIVRRTRLRSSLLLLYVVYDIRCSAFLPRCSRPLALPSLDF